MSPVSEQTILVVDDEEAIAEAVRARLESEGFRVVTAADGSEAIDAHAEHHPDLVVLDLMLPGMDGLEVCQQIQKDGWTPVLMLTARTEEADKVAGFAVGADDYLTKPFGVPELLARLRVALRHAQRGADEELSWTWSADGHGMRLDATRRLCWRTTGGTETEVRLTPTEFRVLLCLARHHGKVLTHGQLLREVWGPDHGGDVAYLRVYLGQLRQKLEPEPAGPRWLLTEPGVGYRMAAADAHDLG